MQAARSRRSAFDALPARAVADRALERYFVERGIPSGQKSNSVPTSTLPPAPELAALPVVANFAEVWLAKDLGRGGPVGVNYLYEIPMPLLASTYGALLAMRLSSTGRPTYGARDVLDALQSN